MSHDLRAPLRQIDGFAQALTEDYAETLDAEGKQDLRWIRNGTQRMGQLIDDLLKLSRISRADLRCVSVDLSTMANDVVADLQQAYPDREVRASIAPRLIGHRGLRGDRLVEAPARPLPLSEEHEVGWHLHPNYWGNGYATEASHGAMQRAFDAGIAEVLAIVRPDNTRSKRVAERLGMGYRGRTDRYYGMQADLYHAARPAIGA